MYPFALRAETLSSSRPILQCLVFLDLIVIAHIEKLVRQRFTCLAADAMSRGGVLASVISWPGRRGTNRQINPWYARRQYGRRKAMTPAQ
jgi:hypothetical protein